MYKKILPIITFAKIDIRRLFRDKVAIFFTFVFPLIFLFVFGGLFGKNNDISFNITLINQSESEFSKNFVKEIKNDTVFKVKEDISTVDDAKQLIDYLIKDYPTGTMLPWETANPPELKGSHKHNVSQGAVKLLLDGQHRVTTLYMLINGKIPPYSSGKPSPNSPIAAAFS